MTALYDTGALIAAERDDRAFWSDHRARLESSRVPVTTAPVLAQASRSPRQVVLRRLLRGCDVAPFTAEDAHEVGALLGRSRTTDVVDAHVVLVASRVADLVVTSDPSDIATLSAALAHPVRVLAV